MAELSRISGASSVMCPCRRPAIAGGRERSAVQTKGHDPVAAARLRASGFTLRSYEPFTRVLCRLDGAAGPANVLWVRDEGSVTARLASAPRLDVVGVRL